MFYIFYFYGNKILSFSERTELFIFFTYLYILIEKYLLYFRSNFIVQADLSFLEHIHVSEERPSLRWQYYSVKYAAAETRNDAVPWITMLVIRSLAHKRARTRTRALSNFHSQTRAHCGTHKKEEKKEPVY